MANLNTINLTYDDLTTGLYLAISDNGGVFTGANLVGSLSTQAGTLNGGGQYEWLDAEIQAAGIDWNTQVVIEATDGVTTWYYPVIIRGTPILNVHSSIEYVKTTGNLLDYDLDLQTGKNGTPISFNHIATDDGMAASFNLKRFMTFEMIEAANGSVTITNPENHRSITLTFDGSGVAHAVTWGYAYQWVMMNNIVDLGPTVNFNQIVQGLFNTNDGMLSLISEGFAGTLDIEVTGPLGEKWDYALSFEIENDVLRLDGSTVPTGNLRIVASDSDSSIDEAPLSHLTSFNYTPFGDHISCDAIAMGNEGGFSLAGASFDRRNDFRVSYPAGPYIGAELNTAMWPRKSSSPSVFARLNTQFLMYKSAVRFGTRNLWTDFIIQNTKRRMRIDIVNAPLHLSFYDSNTKTWYRNQNGAVDGSYYQFTPVGTNGQLFPANTPVLDLQLNGASGSFFAGMNITAWVIHPCPGQLAHMFATELWEVNDGSQYLLTMERLDQSGLPEADTTWSAGDYGIVLSEGTAGWTVAGTHSITVTSNTTNVNGASTAVYQFDITTTL